MQQHPWLLHPFFYQHPYLSSTQLLTALIHLLTDHKYFLKCSTQGKLHQTAHGCPGGGNHISDFPHLAWYMPYLLYIFFFFPIFRAFSLNKDLWSYVHPVFLSSVPSCIGTGSLVLQNPLESQSKAALAHFRRAGIREYGSSFLSLYLPTIFHSHFQALLQLWFSKTQIKLMF